MQLQNAIILKATNSVSVCSVVGVHAGIAAVEVARIGAINLTAPIVAVGPDIVERTIAVAFFKIKNHPLTSASSAQVAVVKKILPP